MNSIDSMVRSLQSLCMLAVIQCTSAYSQDVRSPEVRPANAVRYLDSINGKKWSELIARLHQLSSQQPDSTRGGNQPEVMPAAALADSFRQYYIDFPGDHQSVEARRIEALLLIDAVSGGAETEAERMEAVVASIRSDRAVSAEIRAEIASTYEYRKARSRISGPADVSRVYEEVARAIMAEFPDQPQGSGSLLTLADDLDVENAKRIVQEIIDSPAPVDVKHRARAMAKRKSIVGLRIDHLLGEYVTAAKRSGSWSASRPTIVYFWAPWSPESLRAGEAIRDAATDRANLLGVCLDVNAQNAEIAASQGRLPGYIVYVEQDLKSSLATDLGIVDLPTVFLSDEHGVFTDVKALDDLSAKIQAILN